MNQNNKTTKIFGGLILIFFGIAFLVDQYTVFSFGRIIGYLWPVILIVLGILILMRSSYANKGGWVLVALGTIFFIAQFLSFSIWTLWPLILVFIGVSMLFGWNNKHGINSGSTSTSEDKIDNTVIFWGLDKKINSQNFKGGEVVAIFGGVSLDLTNAKLAPDAKLDVTAIFGGIELKVAPEMSVVNQGTGIFGGFVAKNSQTADASQKLIVTGEAIFGGVEVK